MKSKTTSLMIVTSMSLGVLLITMSVRGQVPTETAAQTSSYSITDLGTLGGDNSIPFWITNTGEVVGVSDTGQFDAFGNPIDHAFRWVGGHLQDLQTLGGNNSTANGANVEGEAVGIADLAGGFTSHAVLWQGGTITDLGALNGPSGYSFAQLVNGSQQVIGASTTADGTFRGFVWDRGVMTELGTLGGANSFALGINDLGQVVGISQVNDIVDPILGFPDFHGTLWDHGKVVNLTPGVGADAFIINNKSQVVGRLLIPDAVEGGVAHAYVWQEGDLTDLGVPAGDDNSQANSINDNGQIVGASGVGFIETYAPDRALLWQNGKLFDLNTVIPDDSGYHLIVAFDINARGQIVVCAVQLSTGNIHAAMLTPQPSNVSGGSASPHIPAPPPPLSENAKRLLRQAMSRRKKH